MADTSSLGDEKSERSRELSSSHLIFYAVHFIFVLDKGSFLVFFAHKIVRFNARPNQTALKQQRRKRRGASKLTPSKRLVITSLPHVLHVLFFLPSTSPPPSSPLAFAFQNLPGASRNDPTMANPPSLKRPKLEKEDYDSAYWPSPTTNGVASVNGLPGNSSCDLGARGEKTLEENEDDEAAAIALVKHRKGEVEQYKLKLLEYQTLLDEAEKRLEEAYAKKEGIQAAKRAANNDAGGPHRQTTPTPVSAAPSSRVAQQQMQPGARPQLVIPAVSKQPVLPSQPRVSVASRTEAVSSKRAMSASSSISSSAPPQQRVAEKPKLEANRPKRKIGNVIES